MGRKSLRAFNRTAAVVTQHRRHILDQTMQISSSTVLWQTVVPKHVPAVEACHESARGSLSHYCIKSRVLLIRCLLERPKHTLIRHFQHSAVI